MRIQFTASSRVHGYIPPGMQNPWVLDVHPAAIVQDIANEIQYEADLPFPVVLHGWQLGQYYMLPLNSEIGHHINFSGNASFIYDAFY
jgi:hypothetical protein